MSEKAIANVKRLVFERSMAKTKGVDRITIETVDLCFGIFDRLHGEVIADAVHVMLGLLEGKDGR